MYNKHDEEDKALREAGALNRMDNRERPRRLRFETDDYNKSKFESLFKK